MVELAPGELAHEGLGHLADLKRRCLHLERRERAKVKVRPKARGRLAVQAVAAAAVAGKPFQHPGSEALVGGRLARHRQAGVRCCASGKLGDGRARLREQAGRSGDPARRREQRTPRSPTQGAPERGVDSVWPAGGGKHLFRLREQQARHEPQASTLGLQHCRHRPVPMMTEGGHVSRAEDRARAHLARYCRDDLLGPPATHHQAAAPRTQGSVELDQRSQQEPHARGRDRSFAKETLIEHEQRDHRPGSGHAGAQRGVIGNAQIATEPDDDRIHGRLHAARGSLGGTGRTLRRRRRRVPTPVGPSPSDGRSPVDGSSSVGRGRFRVPCLIC